MKWMTTSLNEENTVIHCWRTIFYSRKNRDQMVKSTVAREKLLHFWILFFNFRISFTNGNGENLMQSDNHYHLINSPMINPVKLFVFRKFNLTECQQSLVFIRCNRSSFKTFIIFFFCSLFDIWANQKRIITERQKKEKIHLATREEMWKTGIMNPQY